MCKYEAFFVEYNGCKNWTYSHKSLTGDFLVQLHKCQEDSGFIQGQVGSDHEWIVLHIALYANVKK